MAIGTISSVITARFVQNLEFARAGETPRPLSGNEATKVTLSGLNLGTQVFSNAIKGLNNVYNFLDFTEFDLRALSKITDEMIEVVQLATRGGIGASTRAGLNSKFEDLANKFKEVIEESSRGDYSDIDVDDLTSIFQSVGLTKDSSTQLASIINTFVISENEDGDEVLVSDASQAKRPVRIPSSAYTQTGSGVGSGAFSSVVSVNGGREGAVLADVNGDTFLDVIGANDLGTGMIITYGNGNGTFKAPVTIDGYLSPALAVDLDGDSNIDIIGTNGTDFHVRLGNGDGTFDSALTFYGAATGLTSLQLVDIDGDTDLDLIGAHSTTQVGVYLSNGDGSFNEAIQSTLEGTSGVADIKSGDFNNDGFIDLLIADDRGGSSPTDPGRIQILYGNNDGTFAAGVTIDVSPAGGQTQSVEAADFNNDGFLDIATYDSENAGLFIRLGNNDGTFKVSTSFAQSYAVAMESADINGDGLVDILSSGLNGLSVMLGNGDGTFKAERTYAISSSNHQLNIGDMNGDGIDDVVLAKNTTDSFSYFQGERAANYNSIRDFDTIFESGRTIRTRAGAYLMLADLKSLKEQLDTNLKAVSDAKTFIFRNIQLASATGFAFLETANTISETQSDPDTIVRAIREKLRKADRNALAQISNLDPITTAALTTSYSSES